MKIGSTISLVIATVTYLVLADQVSATTIASQTSEYSNQLNVWQVIQELGDNLSGKLESFTFRVQTNIPNNQQFDFTAQNTRIYDKTTNSLVATGCVPSSTDPSDKLRGLTFITQDVPPGYEDVLIDFSCNNLEFIPDHKYLIKISNANICSGCIKFASAAYGPGGTQTTDLFTSGGLRYANGNKFDFSHNSGSCNPLTYNWNDINFAPSSGCFIWTTPNDDLYFILKNNTPEKTPLIFIPGIGGSELKIADDTIWSQDDGHGGIYNHAYKKDDVIWLNENEARAFGNDDYFDILRMKPDGQTSEASIEITGNILTRAYQETLNFFINNGYEPNKTFFIFPYDWRKDISHTKDLLDVKINEIKTQTNTTKVDLIAHSMGGLVARNYISDSSKATNIRKLFTLGTPYLGSVKQIKAVTFGNCLTDSRIESLPFCFGITNLAIKDVIQNMISGYELMPSKSYFQFYNGTSKDNPVPMKINGSQLSYLQTKEFLTSNKYNTILFTPSEIFHSLDNTLENTNGVEVTVVAGSGILTLGQIIEQNKTTLLGKKYKHQDSIQINGDKTVPLFSASLNNAKTGLSFLGNAKIYYTKQTHTELANTGPALNLVKNLLGGKTELPDGISLTPYKLQNRLLFSIHSPVNIHIYDEQGNHTGPLSNEDFETNIPESSYETLGDAKFIYVPNGAKYQIKFDATDNGSFDFKIRRYENDINSETILYEDIPLINSTQGQATYESFDKPPILLMDNDNDGVIDSKISPTSILIGDEVYDSSPPHTKVNISGKLGNDNWYTSDIVISLDAEDEMQGSGMGKIQYVLNDNQIIQTYSNPINVSIEGVTKIKYQASDNAGNVEDAQEQEIKIDKTKPSITTNIPDNSVFILNQNMHFSYLCIDSGSGLETCTSQVTNNTLIDTTTAGPKTITLSTSDKAGNITTKHISYTVQYSKNSCINDLGHTILQPVNVDGTSVFKQGSAIPVKFRVCDFNGLSIGNPNITQNFNLIKVISGTLTQNVNETVNSTTPDTNFHWDASNQQWIFNMDTKSLAPGKTYYFQISLNDMSTMDFKIGLR